MGIEMPYGKKRSKILKPEECAAFYDEKKGIVIGVCNKGGEIFDNLDLKVPRIRFGNLFRPALLTERWKKVDKDYEELLIAMLANGYSKAQMQRTTPRSLLTMWQN